MVILSFFTIKDKINGQFFSSIFLIEFWVIHLLCHGKTEQALLGSILLGIAIYVDKKVKF